MGDKVVSVSIDEDQLITLDELAKAQRANRSFLVRVALDEYFERVVHKLKGKQGRT